MIDIQFLKVHVVVPHSVSIVLVELIEVHPEDEEFKTGLHLVLLKEIAELVDGCSVVSGELVKLVAGHWGDRTLVPDLISHVAQVRFQLLPSLQLFMRCCVKHILSKLELVDHLEDLSDLLVDLVSRWTQERLLQDVLNEFHLDSSDLI